MNHHFSPMARGLSVLLAVSATLSVHADSFGNDRALNAFVKNAPPPCEVPAPNFDFMADAARPFSFHNLTAAAWFARTVQLTSGYRQEAWEKLPLKPVRVQDFRADPWGLHATLLEFDDKVLMMYRGTEDILDYVLNVTFYTTRKGQELGLPGWVHDGFLANFKLSWSRVLDALRESTSSGKQVVFVGHSLGGVMSQYAAWLAENEGMKVVRVYAFQSPNPGDVEFKAAFEERFADRHSNTLYGEDVTPHIPPVQEAADAFGKASIKKLGTLVAGLAKRARYGALTERLRIAENGTYRAVPADAIVQDEINYWDSYQSKSGGKAFPLGLGAQSPFVLDHDIDRVLCSLAKLNRQAK
ncbi:MAG: lipase family protein [Betaproteobacteria bacterium]|nr:lipase family protein [Betaproteobacteria bacterium]